MSYILDALKRSEQERHQDKVADLSADLLILQKKKQKNNPWPIVIALLLLVNVAALFYVFYDSDSEVAAENLHDPNKMSANNNGEAQGIDSVSSREFAPENRPLKSIKAADHSNKAVVKSIPEHVNKQIKTSRIMSIDTASTASKSSKDIDDSAYEIIRPKNFIQTNRVTEAQSNAETGFTDNSETEQYSENDVIRPKNYRAPPVSNPSYKHETVDSTVNSKVQVHGDEAYFESIPHLTDLSLSLQKSVPKLVFNSHIFSDKPSARRVMINNLYMREGEAFSGMTIQAIGEFYIHLRKGNDDFKLPVLRDWTSP